MTWIRMECDAADDEAFDQLGEALGISTGEAFYHYFALVGKLGKMDTGGRLSTLLDRTLEQWAKWRGTPGDFARIFRQMFADAQSGELKGFRRRNEKLLIKQATDRQKRKNLPGSRRPPDNPQETREGFLGVPPENTRANGNGNGNGYSNGNQEQQHPPTPLAADAAPAPDGARVAVGPARQANGKHLILHRSRASPSRSLPVVLGGLQAFLAEVGQQTQRECERDLLRDMMVDLTFAYWAKRMRHETTKLDRKRFQIIRKRLEEGGDNVHEVLYAVDGALKDDNLMGRARDSTRKFDGVSTIYRDREQVERLSELGGYRAGMTHPMAKKYLDGATMAAEGAG